MENIQYETERLILRPAVRTDAAFILELLNSPKWIQNIGDRKVRTEAEAAAYIAVKMFPQFEELGYGNYVIFRKSDGAKIGTCGLYNREGLEGIDIGFAFLPAYERQGFGYEAASKMMDLAINTFDIKIIKGITTKENIASQGLLKKIGLSFVKIINIPNDPEDLMLFEYRV